ncbi:MAG: sigma-70 family RNA polymerase sigma factor [Acetatifactor sp.]|nr:sigma-70 family RNA polymerase sigma factor [Acetatifactor sp.]
MSDKKIISAIAARDERMLAFVVQKYSKLLWRIAASVLINAASVQDVEECVADVFIYLWQYPEKYDPDKAKLSSWLSIVARSRAVDSYRRISRKREISMEKIMVESLEYAEIATADEEIGHSMECLSSMDKLRSCIDGLDEKEKELVIRRYYYEQKPAEIAVALDMPKKQVENKLYYVRQKLRKMMEKQEGDIS